MNKFKITNKELKEDGYNVFKASYCTLQHLLWFESPVAYTAGVYGWNSDVYIFPGYFTIVTGYRPIGKEAILCKEYDNAARVILEHSNLTQEEKKRCVRGLLRRFRNAQYAYYAAPPEYKKEVYTLFELTSCEEEDEGSTFARSIYE